MFVDDNVLCLVIDVGRLGAGVCVRMSLFVMTYLVGSQGVVVCMSAAMMPPGHGVSWSTSRVPVGWQLMWVHPWLALLAVALEATPLGPLVRSMLGRGLAKVQACTRSGTGVALG